MSFFQGENLQTSLKPLNQQVVVITGASSGIGLAAAMLGAERGQSSFLLPVVLKHSTRRYPSWRRVSETRCPPGVEAVSGNESHRSIHKALYMNRENRDRHTVMHNHEFHGSRDRLCIHLLYPLFSFDNLLDFSEYVWLRT